MKRTEKREETMGELIKVDFRNKCVNIDPDEEAISTVVEEDESGDTRVHVFGDSGLRLVMRQMRGGPIFVEKGSVVWMGIALRALQRLWPGGEDELFGPLAVKNYAEQEAAFACGFVEREGLWWRDGGEEWPAGMVEEALEVENAFREEGTEI